MLACWHVVNIILHKLRSCAIKPTMMTVVTDVTDVTDVAGVVETPASSTPATTMDRGSTAQPGAHDSMMSAGAVWASTPTPLDDLALSRGTCCRTAPAPQPVASVSFAAACEELRVCSLRVCEASREHRRARDAVNTLRRTYRVKLKQEPPKTLLQEQVAGRAASKQRLDEALRALDEYMLVVPACDPKPADWKKQVAAAVMSPRERGDVCHSTIQGAASFV